MSTLVCCWWCPKKLGMAKTGRCAWGPGPAARPPQSRRSADCSSYVIIYWFENRCYSRRCARPSSSNAAGSPICRQRQCNDTFAPMNRHARSARIAAVSHTRWLCSHKCDAARKCVLTCDTCEPANVNRPAQLALMTTAQPRAYSSAGIVWRRLGCTQDMQIRMPSFSRQHEG